MAGVAHLVRASGCGSEGSGFETRRLPHFFSTSIRFKLMDIIFFAAIALYIFFRLNKQLGKIDEDEKRQIQEKIAKKREEILAIQNKIFEQKPQNPSNIVEDKASQKIIESLDEKTKENFIDILQKCRISAEFFINGAKSAFEMILKAFADGDLEVLKFLLSDKIYQGFEAAIAQRKLAEKTLITNLIAVEKVEILSAILIDNTASVTVKFVSKQINYMLDKENNVADGAKSDIAEIIDIWTFKKDVTSANPSWIVSATQIN